MARWGLAAPPHPVQLGSGMGAWVRGGECLALQGLPGSHRGKGALSCSPGKALRRKGGGFEKRPCGRTSRAEEGLSGLLDTP